MVKGVKAGHRFFLIFLLTKYKSSTNHWAFHFFADRSTFMEGMALGITENLEAILIKDLIYGSQVETQRI